MDRPPNCSLSQAISHSPLEANLSHAQTGDCDSLATIVRADLGELPAYRIIARSESPLPDFGLKTLDDAEFQALRVEQAIAAYPAEMNEDRNPLEANLKPHISFNKGCYIGPGGGRAFEHL